MFDVDFLPLLLIIKTWCFYLFFCKIIFIVYFIFFQNYCMMPYSKCNYLIIISRVCYAHEYSMVNPRERVMEMHSRNLSFSNIVNMQEKMTYRWLFNFIKFCIFFFSFNPTFSYLYRFLPILINGNIKFF